VIDLARRDRLPLLATNGVLHATPEGRRVLDVFTCLRHHTHLDSAGTLLLPNSEHHLKSAAAMAALFADLPAAIANTVRLGERLQFTLADLGYEFPRFPVGLGETMESVLREQTYAGARQRYAGNIPEKVRTLLKKELALINKLGFAGYFLIVADLVRFCREHDILAQGRGSAANSAVCFCLCITAVDPVKFNVLFERSSAKAIAVGRTSISTCRAATARARHPGSLPSLWTARRGDDGDGHHLRRPQFRARTWQGVEPARRRSRSILEPVRER
jgi:error-prone DNA polymerase